MLSYRHAYHAGNYADILKHIIYIDILEHLSRKEKAFDIIDTHAGAGLFDLQSEFANKVAEYREGIAKLERVDFPELKAYFDCLDLVNPKGGLRFYPGSPSIAAQYLRKQDRAWLYELHPNDVRLLEQSFGYNKRVKIEQTDGLKGLLAHMPPTSRRAAVLIDPSYEDKSDYEQVFQSIEKAYTKFPSGVFALWYPVVDRARIDTLHRRFLRSGIKNISVYELGVLPDSEGRGMSSSGMLLVNPPWTLQDKMQLLLPRIAKCIAQGPQSVFRCEQLVGE